MSRVQKQRRLDKVIKKAQDRDDRLHDFEADKRALLSGVREQPRAGRAARRRQHEVSGAHTAHPRPGADVGGRDEPLPETD